MPAKKTDLYERVFILIDNKSKKQFISDCMRPDFAQFQYVIRLRLSQNALHQKTDNYLTLALIGLF